MSGSNIPTLAEFYQSRGLNDESWHLGPEHPALEELALRTLQGSKETRILEVGVQSGGFAVPVILAASKRSGFSYVGIDNLQYTNAVPLHMIANYLELHGITHHVRFIESDSTRILAGLNSQFDVILLDHYKPKYPIDLFTVLQRNLLAPGGSIILHDVLTHAASGWKYCALVCRAFGHDWTIDANVSQGAALVRASKTASPSAMLIAIAGIRVKLRWYTHAWALRVRRRLGRILRAFGLR